MGGKYTTAGAELALNKTHRNAGTQPTTHYIGLATVALTKASTLASITEVTTPGYARQAVVFTAPTGDPSNIENTAQLTFGAFTADPPEVAYAFYTDAASGTSGTIYNFWDGSPVDAANGESMIIAAGSLDFSLD